MQMKAQLDHLTGRNEELRSELRATRAELSAKYSACEIAQQTASKFEADLKSLREAAFNGNRYQPIQLPPDIPVTSSMLIMSLNEQLIHVLQVIV